MIALVPEYLPSAREDLRAIGDSSVSAEIMMIIRDELRIPPGNGPIDGKIILSSRNTVWWRRAVRFDVLTRFMRFDLDDDLDEFRTQACDYVIIFRLITSDERIRFKRVAKDTVLIIRIVRNDEMARLIQPDGLLLSGVVD